MRNFFAVVFVGGLLGASLSAHADEIYRGVIQVDGQGKMVAANGASGVRYMPVVLSFNEHSQLGELGGRIRFEAPWSCGFELVDAKPQYAFKGAGAGKCTTLDQGYLVSERTESNEMKISIYDPNGKSVNTFGVNKNPSK